MSNTALVNNVYFTSEAFNNGFANIPAEEDTSLLYPLIQSGDSQNYQIAIDKIRVPLGTIPLSGNIGLKKYEIILRNQNTEASAYVKQINALTGNFYYVLNNNSINRYSYTNTSTTLTKTIQLDNICNFVYQFVIDDFENIYIACSNTSTEFSNELIILDSNIPPNILYQEKYDNIKSIYIDSNSKFYLINEYEGSSVLCFNNNNKLNTVELDLNFTIDKNFSNNPLTNSIFVVASDENIIVANNNNILSYYTINGTPITDISTSAKQLVAGNILVSQETLMTGEINQLNDALIGVNLSKQVANIETNQIFPGGGLIDSSLAITGDNAYALGLGKTLYAVEFPITTGDFNEINLKELEAVAGRQNNVLIGTTNLSDLFFLNQNIPFNGAIENYLGLSVVNFKPTSEPIISMDWDISNDSIIAVDNTNKLYVSDTAIYPLGFIGFGNNGNNIEIQGYENFQNTDNQMTTHLLKLFPSVLLTGTFCTKNGIVYGIKGVLGSQQVIEMNMNFEETGVIFPCPECNGVIKAIDIVDNNIVVVGNNDNIAIYSIISKVLVRNITVYQGNSIKFTGFQDGSTLVITHNNNLAIYNYITGVLLSDQLLQNSNVMNAITCNPNDLTNDLAKIFISYFTNNNNQYNLDFITLNTNYTIANQIRMDNSNSPFGQLFFNVDNGILINSIIINQNAPTVKLYYQSQNYTASGLFNFITTQPYEFIYFPQTLTGVYTFTNITTNITPISVAVSRTNTNKIYAINSVDNLIYSGTLLNNNITFNQLTQFTTKYLYISTCKNFNIEIDSILRTFNISNQKQISTISITNNKVDNIAKNEETNEFLVGLNNTNQINSYSKDLTLNYTLEQNNPVSLFVKTGDDINISGINIYNLQDVVDNINNAFNDAWSKLKTIGTSATFTDPPNITIDLNGYLTLNYSPDYTQTGNGILFNNYLMNICYFQNIPDKQDIGFFKINLKNNTTSTMQLSKSIFQFNQLDKILIQSTSLFVSGSWYGRNSISQILTDIDVPIDNFAIGNIGQVLYYQPTHLRVYQMATGGNPISRIQISILYRYKDGTQYTLELSPGESFSVKLNFIKKF